MPVQNSQTSLSSSISSRNCLYVNFPFLDSSSDFSSQDSPPSPSLETFSGPLLRLDTPATPDRRSLHVGIDRQGVKGGEGGTVPEEDKLRPVVRDGINVESAETDGGDSDNENKVNVIVFKQVEAWDNRIVNENSKELQISSVFYAILTMLSVTIYGYYLFQNVKATLENLSRGLKLVITADFGNFSKRNFVDEAIPLVLAILATTLPYVKFHHFLAIQTVGTTSKDKHFFRKNRFFNSV
ncbi:hypothetical protein JCM3765_005378 [Sporobolomyces pararoseus]